MNKPIVFTSIIEFQKYCRNTRGTVGFVPTMGALHEGHASLLQQSARENNITILSIFVNPTQFNDPADLEKYPRTLDADIEFASAYNVHAIFCPEFLDMYPDNYKYSITENNFSKVLCGSSRPGHFDGVLTVVMKLINIVNPEKAYFGEKDFQQLTLIKDMVKDFFMPVEICSVKTVREPSGLAMSSRNTRLSSDGKIKAALIYKTLTETKTTAETKQILTQAGFNIDYLEDVNGRRYIAAFLEGVRLIDNVII